MDKGTVVILVLGAIALGSLLIAVIMAAMGY